MMKVNIPQGKYVVAVSGGVDSMVLLDILAKQSGEWRAKSKERISSNLSTLASPLVVAHFNHGIRPDSRKDEEFVKKTAENYGLPFEVGYGRLGPEASEEKARAPRYKFLKKVKQKYQADKIITAHHQDDLIETAILNIMRGTGRRGLTAMAENPDILRPMLHLPKNDILRYAKKINLKWREDPTNKDERYLRNYIRHRIVAKLKPQQRQKLLKGLNRMAATNRLIDSEIANLSQKLVVGHYLKRSSFIALPMEIAQEVMVYFLRQNDIRQFDRPTIERLVVAAKTAKPGTKHDVVEGYKLSISQKFVSLSND